MLLQLSDLGGGWWPFVGFALLAAVSFCLSVNAWVGQLLGRRSNLALPCVLIVRAAGTTLEDARYRVTYWPPVGPPRELLEGVHFRVRRPGGVFSWILEEPSLREILPDAAIYGPGGV